MKEFFKFALRKFHFPEYMKFFKNVFFFLSLESFPLKCFNLEAGNFHFPKYKKNIFLRRYKNFFNIGVEKFRFPKYKKFFQGGFF